MDSQCRWTLFHLFLLLSQNISVVLSQNAVPNGIPPFLRESDCGIPGIQPVQQMNNYFPIYPPGVQELQQVIPLNECQQPICQEQRIQDAIRAGQGQFPVAPSTAGIPRNLLPRPTLFGPSFLPLSQQNVAQQCPGPITPNALPPAQCPANVPVGPLQLGSAIIPGSEIPPCSIPGLPLVPQLQNQIPFLPPGFVPLQGQELIPSEGLPPQFSLGGPLFNKLPLLPQISPLKPLQPEPILPIQPADVCFQQPYPQNYPLLNEQYSLTNVPNLGSLPNVLNLNPYTNVPNLVPLQEQLYPPTPFNLLPGQCQIPGQLPVIGPLNFSPVNVPFLPLNGPVPPPNVPIIPQGAPINQNLQLFPLGPSNLQPTCQNAVPPCIPNDNIFPPLSANFFPLNPNILPSLPNPDAVCVSGPILPASPAYQSVPITLSSGSNVYSQMGSIQSEDCSIPVPINLHINLPAPIIPTPKITIINPTPSVPETTSIQESSNGDIDIIPPYPLPPIIIEGRRSRSNSWWPLLIVALFAGDGFCGGNFGGGGGCCSSNSGQTIPIPYPIAIPTNNPIIIGDKPSSCPK